MDIEKIRQGLPEHPRPGMAHKVWKKFRQGTLGGDFCIFRQECIPVYAEEIQQTMTPEDSTS